MQRAFGPWLDDRLQNWHRVRRQVDDVIRLAPTPGPKFVFLHVLVPHPPYVFDRDGGYVTKAEERKRSLAENYTNQVQAANAMIRRMVDGILRDAPSPPVIIVQGDEGPIRRARAGKFDWRTATRPAAAAEDRNPQRVLLAGRRRGLLYPSISPVNSFRVVFNSYFGAACRCCRTGPCGKCRTSAIRVRRHHQSADGDRAVDRESGMIAGGAFWSNGCAQS